MRHIKLTSKSLNKDWSMQFMDDSHYDKLIDESVKITKPDGSPLLVLLKKAMDPQITANAWSSLKKINIKTENRSTAAGIEAVGRVKRNGDVSSTSRVPKGWEVVSGIIGSFERTVRSPYAHHCAWNTHHPDKFAVTVPLFQQAASFFKEHVPDRYEAQMEYVRKTNPAWIVPDTAYTTVTVNKNFRTAAHLDAGDLASGFSNMIVIKQGKSLGGHLVLPNWRLAVKLDNLDLVMFDAHEWHGNTPVLKMSKDAVRCTLVCYYREHMHLCGSPEYELNQAKNRKPGQPIYWEKK